MMRPVTATAMNAMMKLKIFLGNAVSISLITTMVQNLQNVLPMVNVSDGTQHDSDYCDTRIGEVHGIAIPHHPIYNGYYHCP